MEAIRSVQRLRADLGTVNGYCGKVEIVLDYDRKQIEIRDNGRGMTDGDIRNAVNYGRLKNRTTTSSHNYEKVVNQRTLLLSTSADWHYRRGRLATLESTELDCILF